MKDEEMIKFIEETFEENYELLRLEGGHSLSPYVKKLALEQVKLYWKKLRKLAENVSETEVKLTLPLQETPSGRKYTIQGVVDVVEEANGTILYDIKTHDVDYVRHNIVDYEGQLNIYAHIWQNIRGQKLDGTAIVATGQTEEIKRAFQSGDPTRIEKVLNEWDPVVTIEIDQEMVQESIFSFGEVVDRIEDNKFAPSPYEKLTTPIRDDKIFVKYICHNCDVRFSCDSYRQYAFTSTRAKNDFMSFYDDYGTENERIEILDANLVENYEV